MTVSGRNIKYICKRCYSVFRLSAVLFVSEMEWSGFPETLYLIQTIYLNINKRSKAGKKIERLILKKRIEAVEYWNNRIDLIKN